MTPTDRKLMIVVAEHLCGFYDLSYGQIARHIKKHYGFTVHRSTVFRWLN